MREFDDDTREGRELAALWRWRLQRARAVGLSQVQAEILADLELDTHDVVDLAEAGCPADLIVELLV